MGSYDRKKARLGSQERSNDTCPSGAKTSASHLCDVSLDLSDAGQWSHGLQVHCHDLHLLSWLLTLFLLTPPPRSATKANVKWTALIVLNRHEAKHMVDWIGGEGRAAEVGAAEVAHLSLRLSTWLQLPGAAHRSTALLTPGTAQREPKSFNREDRKRELIGDDGWVGGYHWAAAVTCKQIELLIELQQLESTAGPPALLLGQPVVDVSLVFGGAAHPDC